MSYSMDYNDYQKAVYASIAEIEELAETNDAITPEEIELVIEHNPALRESLDLDLNREVLTNHFYSAVQSRLNRRYMSANELYALPGKPYHLGYLRDTFNTYFDDVALIYDGDAYGVADAAKEITVKEHFRKYIGEGHILLASVYYKGQPFMVAREWGEEQCTRLITDEKLFIEATKYLREVYASLQPEPTVYHTFDPNKQEHFFLNLGGYHIEKEKLS